MKVSIKACLNNGVPRVVLTWTPPGGKRRRQFFRTKAEAEAERDEIIRQHQTAGEVWLSLSPALRGQLAILIQEAIDGGFTLREAVDYYKANGKGCPTCTLGDAFKDFMEEKRSLRLARPTLWNYTCNVGRFIKGQEASPVGSVTREAILAWLSPYKSPRTWTAYLVTLQTFFRWCKKTKRCGENPAESIPRISPRRMPDIDEPPAILTVPQCRALLAATLRSDRRLVPYVALCLFAGLRPDREAAEMTWKDIGETELTVRGKTAKDRQARHITISLTLTKWLALGGDLPVVNRRRRMRKLRQEAGFTEWQQDVLRHTFASNYFATHGAEATVAALGHGNFQMLFRHYRALVTPADAAEFWKLTPEALQGGDGLNEPLRVGDDPCRRAIR